MASASVPGGAAGPERDRALVDCEHLLAHVEVLVGHRRLGPMAFEDAVSTAHRLVHDGVPLSQIRLVHARHRRTAHVTQVVPHDGAGSAT